MEIKKQNGRYYVNELDLEELISNRKYIVKFVNNEVDYLKSIKANKELWQEEYATRIKVLEEIKEMLKLRR